MNKNIIIASILSLGFVIGLTIVGQAFKHRNQSDNTVSVTGLGSKTFTSDLITWQGNFSNNSMELNAAYAQLANDKKIIHEYLTSKGIAEKEIIFSAVDIQKIYNYGTDEYGRSYSSFSGYLLSQNVSIESQEVEKIEQLSRNITEIINQGIEFTSSAPQYFYTKLSEVKHEMIADATKDAKIRAEKIAENAGSRLGKLKKANTGVIQITAPNSNEDYSYGGTFNTYSKEKEASITIRLEYQLE